jgi:pimeloyl-ACP methyl ester carboxylesterase
MSDPGRTEKVVDPMKTAVPAADSTRVTVALSEHLVAFRAAHPRQRVTICGTEWSYLIGGRGAETFLILPGGERIGDVAFPLFEAFADDFHCLYPSFPPLTTIDALVEGVAALLDHRGIEQVILFGASFGGDVAQCFIRKYPSRVSKLVLMNTGVPDERIGRATRRFRPLVALPPMPLARALTRLYLNKALAVRPEERDFWHAMLRDLIAQLTRADLVASFDDTLDYRLNYHFLPADLAAWPGELLILQSDDDPATTPAVRAALRGLYPRARVHTFHAAGHTPFLSQPDEFYAEVRPFVRQD